MNSNSPCSTVSIIIYLYFINFVAQFIKSSTVLKRCRGSWYHVLIQGYDGITSFIIFDLSLQGTDSCSVKKWFKAQIHVSGILPDVFSYSSHFICLYNFNYTSRPLPGPGIIGI